MTVRNHPALKTPTTAMIIPPMRARMTDVFIMRRDLAPSFAPRERARRIFVPLADFAEALCFKYSYDSEANEAVIVSSQSEQ